MKRVSFKFSPPINATFAKLMKEPTFIRDAEALSQLKQEQFDRLLEGLRAPKVFLDYEAISSAVESLVDSPEPVHRIIAGLNQMVKNSDDAREETLEALEEVIRESEEFSNADLIADRIMKLLTVEGLSLQSKAEYLLSMGVGVDSVEIVCDLRPVFSSDRTEVAGVMPITTMYLDIEGQDSLMVLSLTEELLESLTSKAIEATNKLQILADLCDEKKLKMPNLSEQSGMMP